MRKYLLPAILLSTIAAMPATAQPYGHVGGQRFDRQIDQLVYRIRTAEDRNLISRNEEYRLLGQARRLQFLENRYSRNGLSRWEARDLQSRIHQLRAQFRWERADGRRYGYR